MNEDFVKEVAKIYREDGILGILERFPNIDKMKFEDQDRKRGEFTITLDMKDILFLALIYFAKKYADKVAEKTTDWTLQQLAKLLRERKSLLMEFFESAGFEEKRKLAEELIRGVEEASRRIQ